MARASTDLADNLGFKILHNWVTSYSHPVNKHSHEKPLPSYHFVTKVTAYNIIKLLPNLIAI